MQPPWPVGAKQQGLFDVGGARRAGDEIDRARQRAGPISRAQFGEHAFVIGDDVGGEDDDEMVVGQEVERRRIVGAGDQRQRAGLGDGGEGGADRIEIVALRRSARDFERGRRPRQVGEARIVAEAQRRRQVVLA